MRRPAARAAHVYAVVWDARARRAQDVLASVDGPPRLVVDMVVRLPGEAQARLRWVDVTRYTSDRLPGAQRAACRDGVAEVRWTRLAPGTGYLVEALYEVPRGVDLADLTVHLEPSRSPDAALPADSLAAPELDRTLVSDAAGALVPAPDQAVARTRLYMLRVLWIATVLLASIALFRATLDFLFRLHRPAVTWLALGAVLALGGWWLMESRVLLYSRFPVELLPDL